MIEKTPVPVSAEAAAALSRVHAAAFAEQGARGWSPSEFQALLDRPAAGLLVAGSALAPRGFLIYDAVAGEAEVLTLAVDPACWRAGIGQALLTACSEELAKEKIERLLVEVAEDNTSALKLYSKAGFQTVGRRPEYYWRQGKAIDARLMSLLIKR